MRQGLLSVLRDLATRRGRERRGLARAEGVRLVEEALAAGEPVPGAAVGPALEGTPRGRALKAALEAAGVPLEALDDTALAELADTEQPQGIVAAVRPPAWTLEHVAARPGRAVLVLDAVQDPGNVGTMLRSAFALGAAGVVALPGTAELHNPKALRGAMGATFRLPCVAAPLAALEAWLDRHATPLWAADLAGDDAHALGPRPPRVALAVGNEGAGVGGALLARAARRVRIPLADGAESLSVGAAAAILLHELRRDA
ncbi:MAG: RNA methyltransferase [Gemmatimonadales bacterium]|nr:RNA methyltransferase [Gemmatimonadales bacterium]